MPKITTKCFYCNNLTTIFTETFGKNILAKGAERTVLWSVPIFDRARKANGQDRRRQFLRQPGRMLKMQLVVASSYLGVLDYSNYIKKSGNQAIDFRKFDKAVFCLPSRHPVKEHAGCGKIDPDQFGA